MNEEFKTLDFTGGRYSVSNYGRIRNNYSGISFFPSRSGDVYRRFSFRRKKYRVHRLVAQEFLPNPRNLAQVRHIDSTAAGKLNNHIENLKWCSAQENALSRKNVILTTPGGYTPVIWISGTQVILKPYASKTLAELQCKKFKRIFCH